MTHTSRVDFNTTCSNSSKLHIILSPVGHVNEGFISEIPQELAKVPLPNSQQLVAKFVLQSAPIQSDWSDVQYYRRPIGLLCIAHIDNNNDTNLSNILPQYEKIKRRLESTVIDSRCIIFSKESLMLPPDCIRPDIMVIQYNGTAGSIHCEELTAMIGEFTQALFSVLVRKTIEMSTEKFTSVHLLYSPYERSKSGLDEGKTGKRRIQGRHKKHLGDLYLIIGKPDKANEAYDEALKILLAIGDSMWVGAAYEGQCCAIARMIHLEMGEQRQFLLSKADRSSQESLNSISSEPELKSEENLIRIFRCALNSMEKIREASLIMLETTLKFIRLMIELDNKREACDIINTDIWYCYDDLTAVERLQLYCTIAMLYQEMGMTRKYCYYVRRAALESIGERMSRAYTISSSLLCNVIEKYGVVPGDQGDAIGWPRLQKLVLEDLIATSEKLANSDIVVKYGMCLLQNFYSHLNYDDQLRILNLIFKNNTRLGEHIIEVSNVPICKKIIIKQLGKALEPLSAKQSDSVFIFAPKTSKEKEDYNSEVWWVCHEFGEVHLRLENPLLHALQLFDIRCVVQGGEVECYPGTITINPKQTIDIILSVKPRQPTPLKLTGIQLQLCGVPCHIAVDIPTEIRVSPPMPLLTVRDTIPPTLSLYEGECSAGKEYSEFRCTVVNNSVFPIDSLDIVEHRKSDIFKYEHIPTPIPPKQSVEFTVRIDTNITYAKRSEYIKDDTVSASSGGPQRRGTIYENTSSDENLDLLAQTATRCKRVKTPDQIFTEEMFYISFRYYDNARQFYRQTDIQFNTQIMLLYKLDNYRIVQHPLYSEQCKWELSLTSICPVRMEVVVAGATHHLDPGEQLSSCVELGKVEGTQGDPSVEHRVKHSDLLPKPCMRMDWSIGVKQGWVDLIASLDRNIDLTQAFKESISISYQVSDEQLAGERRSVTLGQPINIAFSIQNTSNFAEESLLFFVQAFCDGTKISKTLYPVPFIGCRDLEIETLGANSTITHDVALLPLNCGSFYLEVGVCNLPAVTTPTACLVQYRNTRSQSALSFEDHIDDLSPIVPRKIIMQNINEGLPVPRYTNSWKMRPSLYFDVLKYCDN